MKTTIDLIVFVLFACLVGKSNAQSTNMDSISFEQQRTRVNLLLDDRSNKFGQFDNSLQQKTGIFGIFKTKKDMQNSIDILKQIVITDNNIFVETKKLLDIKDYESERNRALATEYDTQVTAYMKTISKLQKQNEELRETLESAKEENHDGNNLFYISLLAIAIMGYYIFKLHRTIKSQKVTKV